MSPPEITAIASGFVVVIAQVGQTLLMLRNAREANAQRAVLKKTMDEVHSATNGLSQRNEAIARQLGVHEGEASARNTATRGNP